MSFQGKHVWIIGASTGIGLALAKELSLKGAILALSARDAEKLGTLRHQIGLHHHVLPLDVTNLVEFIAVANQVRNVFKKIDSIIYLAAVYQPMSLLELDSEMTASIVNTNLNGPLNLIQAITPLIKSKAISQIALCGSVAGYCGLPNGQPYSATKAAVINLAQSLRAELPNDIDIKLISPGFVRTALTDKNKFKMPMIIEPEQAAKEIANGLLKDKFEIHFPKRFSLITKLVSILPYKIYFKIIENFK